MKPVRTFLSAQVAGLPAAFWWIWAGAFVSALATFVFLFLAVYLTGRGLDPGQVGLVVGCQGLGAVAAGPLGGTLADRLGRRPTLLAALVASALCATWLGAVRAPALVVPGVLAFGLAASAVFPALFAAVADVVPEPDRARAYALLYWANNVGIGLSAVVGGAVGERSWLALFLADAATTLLFAAIVWRRVPETHPGRGAPDPRPGGAPAPAPGWSAVLRDRAFLAFLAAFTAFLVVFFQFLAGLPMAMTLAGLGPAQIGRVLAVNGLLIATLSPFAARVVAGRDPGRVLAAGALLVGTGYGAYAVCSTVPQLAAATAVWTLGEIATMPVAMAVVSALAPVELRGRYNGAYSFTFGAGQTLAPIAGGALLSAAGPRTLFAACGVACVAVAAAHVALGASRARARVPAAGS